jgi:D-arabinose 1-dehydrogenase-like Zn-dependent alcohol dehydrogenase
VRRRRIERVGNGSCSGISKIECVGVEVTAISHSAHKAEDAQALGASHFIRPGMIQRRRVSRTSNRLTLSSAPPVGLRSHKRWTRN